MDVVEKIDRQCYPWSPTLACNTQTIMDKRGNLLNILPSQQINTARKKDGTFFTHRN